MKFTIGADPEFFLLDSKLGYYVSAHNVIPGTKDNPHPVNCGAIQVDGTAVEFNINPAETEDEFVHNVHTVMGELRKIVPEKYQFVFRPAITYKASYFQKLPREAIELGCNPDYNAYTVDKNPIPNAAVQMRTASGHVHIGWERDYPEVDRDHIILCARLSRNLDVTLGLPSLEWDPDATRRQLYGKAGAYRPKPYGIEYRTLSCAWLRHEDLMRRVYRGAIEGATNFFEKGPDCYYMNMRQDEIVNAINNGR